MLINGVFPGPPIIADWGDILEITVENKLNDNGTSIHWHGMRQLNTNLEDGANGITECPIAPHTSRKYTFRATQYGTSWYHSHFSSQYGNGIVGAMQINGPASADYDYDLGPYVITDYYYDTADFLQRKAELSRNGPPPPSNNILFNGTNVSPSGPSKGEFSRVSLQPGKKHRLRLINTSVDNGFTVSLVGHKFTVIATDLVPVAPIEKTSLFLAVGQRYDVIIDANQAAGNYWFNATLAKGGACGSTLAKDTAAIFSYGVPAGGVPADRGLLASNATCVDTQGFSPVVTRTAPIDKFNLTPNSVVDVVLTSPTAGPELGSEQVFRWKVRGNDINVQWEKPILEYVATGNNSFPARANVINVEDADVWTWWLIENVGRGPPHPIHLHGHDFLVLGTGTGTPNIIDTTEIKKSLSFENPIRRDVAMLPSQGWLAIAFKTDNPGAWLMHCHIAWHVSQGLSVQFLERQKEIPNIMALGNVKPTCDAWREYEPTMYYQKLDSGL
jgi:FtsP/CotA-like multicopper oxidase with cupredoxin domain